MMTSQQQDQQRDIDELSDTTSELATAIHASSFASAARQQLRPAPDSSVVAQAGGGGGGGPSAAADGGGSQNAQPVQESSFLKPTTTTFAGGAPTSNSLSADDAKRRGKTIVFVAVAAIIVAIAVVAYVTSRSDGTGNGGDGNDPRSIVDQVIQKVSSNVALRDPDSPQHRAREWMTKVDQLTAVIKEEGVDRIHQRYALATFYFATGGGDRRWNRAVVVGEPPFDFLNPATSECKWSGIVCASTDPLDETTVGSSNRRLRRLYDRQRRVLPGEESDAAAAATPDPVANTNINSTVIGLSFSHRNLTGALPLELGTMSFLRRIDLSSNQLVGTIPDEAVMEKMKNLWWLDLSDNRFIGNIPKSLWRLPELTHLFLFRNQLSGKIERHEEASSVTAAASSSSSQTTTTTSAGAADAGGVASLIKPLREVYLYENQLTGRLPSWFHEMDQLDRWLSYKNQLTGPLPVLQPEKLSVLDVSFNLLAGTIPPSLWATGSPLPPLEALYLEHNQLTGPIPNSTEPQQVIKLVSVHNNRLSGRIPEGFGLAWPNIQELRLHNNTITGTIPSSLWGDAQSPEKLTHINLSGNDLSGALPGSAQVRNLQEVRLQDNPRLGGTIPTDFAYTWKNLSVLEIQDTALVGQLGPNVTSPSGECPTVWPRYSEVVTSFRFAANCYRLFVTDPNPPVQCDCCTDCVEV
jgi:Leucine-rich repeat (LRR) protein